MNSIPSLAVGDHRDHPHPRAALAARHPRSRRLVHAGGHDLRVPPLPTTGGPQAGWLADHRMAARGPVCWILGPAAQGRCLEAPRPMSSMWLSAREASMISGQRGQAIVEFALIMPILMLILLGIGEITFLAAWGHNSQQTADVLADIAASRMTPDNESWRSGWTPVAAEEIAHAGCESVDVTFPDGTHRYGDRVRVILHLPLPSDQRPRWYPPAL